MQQLQTPLQQLQQPKLGQQRQLPRPQQHRQVNLRRAEAELPPLWRMQLPSCSAALLAFAVELPLKLRRRYPLGSPLG